MLVRHMNILPEDPGEFRFHMETTEEWLKMLTAQYQDEHGLWQCPSGKANHGWDCEV
ncbi:MAG: terminase gpA endonuclease subunit [Thermotogota bacterium]